MRLLNLKAINFRNIKESCNIEFSSDFHDIFLVGNNGQGKTNFLEAIYFLCFGSSFRTRLSKRIIQYGKSEAFLSCTFLDTENTKREISIRLLPNKAKEIRLDSKIIDDRKLLIEATACVVFTHEDMEFVNGAPDKKRWFINQTTSMVDHQFIDILRKYSKILKSRNIALRNKQLDIAELYNEKLIESGLSIQKKRMELINEFNITFSKLFSEIAGKSEGIRLVYKPSWKGFSKNQILAQFKTQIDRDMLYGATLTGPHRDTFEYISSELNFVHFASTGQLRLLSLILRAAQLKFVSIKTKKKYIILLDDVLLELDREKRMGFLRELEGYEQAFFTFLPDEPTIDTRKPEAAMFLVNNGEIRRWKKQETF
jgi:DNA replication and repair protein RecF